MSEFASRWEARRGRTATYAATLALSLSLVGCGHTEDEPHKPTTSSTWPTSLDTPTPTESPGPTTRTPKPRPIPSLPPITSPPEETVTVTAPWTEVPTTSAPYTPTPTPTPQPLPKPTTAPTPSPSPTIQPTESVPQPSKTETIPVDDGVINCLVDHCIALTFDDGPGKYTDQLLGYLDEYNADATFFVVGDQVDMYPSVANRIVASGSQIGNHSTHHDRLTEMSLQAADEDIRTTQNKIEWATGVRPNIMRPPGGQTNQTLVEYIDLPQILWSVDTLDWKYRSTEYIEGAVLENASRGDIVLLHDIHPTTVNAMPRVLKGLTGAGYKLVTIDQLLGTNLPTDRYRQQDMSTVQ